MRLYRTITFKIRSKVRQRRRRIISHQFFITAHDGEAPDVDLIVHSFQHVGVAFYQDSAGNSIVGLGR